MADDKTGDKGTAGTKPTGVKSTNAKSYWNVDEELVKHVAKIARIELTEDELEKFTQQLKSILDAFKKIDEVDTTATEPSFHPQPLSNDWRDDDAKPWHWQPLANTKHKEDKHFKGPKIV